MTDLERAALKQWPRYQALARELLTRLWADEEFRALHRTYGTYNRRIRDATTDEIDAVTLSLALFGHSVRAAGASTGLQVILETHDEREAAYAGTVQQLVLGLGRRHAEPLGVAYEQPFSTLIIGQALLCKDELRTAKSDPPGPGEVYLPALFAFEITEEKRIVINEAPAWSDEDNSLAHRHGRLNIPGKRLPHGAVTKRRSAIDTVGPLIHELRTAKVSWPKVAADERIRAAYGPIASEDTLRKLYSRWRTQNGL